YDSNLTVRIDLILIACGGNSCAFQLIGYFYGPGTFVCQHPVAVCILSYQLSAEEVVVVVNPCDTQLNRISGLDLDAWLCSHLYPSTFKLNSYFYWLLTIFQFILFFLFFRF